MQPILAESAPHRGRAVVFAAVLAVVAAASLALVGHHHRRHHEHHQVQRYAKYAHGNYACFTR